MLDYLPEPLRRAIAGDYRPEPRAECGSCRMIAEPEAPWAFHPVVRCCTYHPSLVNLLAGRVLRRGGTGAERLRERMANPDGVGPWGVEATSEFRAAYDRDPDRFGRDYDQRCPYWVPGPHGCGVWHDRAGVCRTWFCAHDHGLAGAERWSALNDVLSDFEHGLGDLLIELGDPDAHADLAAWYLWCAERADDLTADELAPVLAGAADSLAALRPPAAAPARPHRARPAVTHVHGLGDRVGLCGYSPFDVVVAPRSVFALLSGLSGGADLDATAAANGIDDEVVDELVRVAAIEPAGDD